MKHKKEYDMSMMGKALTGLVVRLAVAGYIAYLAWQILTNTLNGGSPIPDWGAWLIFAAFIAAGVAFCVYAVKQYLIIRKLAELPEIKENDIENKSETDGKD
ncbi:MAG: hypothetical protein VB064_04140 [Oscillospiraceae bacterium]|nr:hypothetical protein [Oscillospiraceae bacterium]